MLRICCFILVLYFPNAFAQKQLVFASINHPTIENYYEPLLRSIYSELGYTIEYVYISGERSEKSIESGLIDGAVIYTESNLERVKNVNVIKTALTSAKQYLFCKQGVICNKEIINDPSYTIYMSVLMAKTNGEMFGAQVETMTSISVLEKLFNHDRINYMIYPFSKDRNDASLVFPKAKRIFLFEEHGFHVLNIKHSLLVKDVEALLKVKLEN